MQYSSEVQRVSRLNGCRCVLPILVDVQVEYASKAVDNAALCMAAACRGGVAFAVEKQKHSVMLAPGFGRRIYSVTNDIGMRTRNKS